MKEVRLYFQRMHGWVLDACDEFLKEDKPQDEKYRRILVYDCEDTINCIDGITDKLFTINKEDRIIYINLILSEIDIQMRDPMHEIIEVDTLYIDGFGPIKPCVSYFLLKRIGLYIDIGRILDEFEYYLASVFSVFQAFGFKMDEIIDKRTDLKYDYEEALQNMKLLDKGYIQKSDFIRDHRGIQPKATLTQQWMIIRNLMECAIDWKLTNDDNQLMYNKTDVAKFISFLCGGSEERIRKHLEDEPTTKDIKDIIPYLESIGLHEISNRIKNDTK